MSVKKRMKNEIIPKNIRIFAHETVGQSVADTDGIRGKSGQHRASYFLTESYW